MGDQVYRIWVAYLAGSSLAFARGSVRIYQTLASRAERGPPPVPATRADLYPPTDSAKPRETLPLVPDDASWQAPNFRVGS